MPFARSNRRTQGVITVNLAATPRECPLTRLRKAGVEGYLATDGNGTAQGDVMDDGVEELLENVEEEFGVVVPDHEAAAELSPNELVEFLIRAMPAPSESMSEDEQLEHIESVLGEVMVRSLGITRYDADMPIGEIAAAVAARGAAEE
jgi:hypothetical protein